MEKVIYLIDENQIQRIVKDVIDQLKPTKQEKGEEKAEKLLTTTEAMEFLRCSKPTLHRWKKEGLIPFVRIGVNIRYKESDLKELLAKKGA